MVRVELISHIEKVPRELGGGCLIYLLGKDEPLKTKTNFEPMMERFRRGFGMANRLQSNNYEMPVDKDGRHLS